jgi:hypothetical protein
LKGISRGIPAGCTNVDQENDNTETQTLCVADGDAGARNAQAERLSEHGGLRRAVGRTCRFCLIFRPTEKRETPVGLVDVGDAMDQNDSALGDWAHEYPEM